MNCLENEVMTMDLFKTYFNGTKKVIYLNFG